MSLLSRWWGFCCGSRLKPPRGGGDMGSEAAFRDERHDLAQVRNVAAPDSEIRIVGWMVPAMVLRVSSSGTKSSDE
jgi:hypothetical protein